jgi:FAD/FMN-containing dehydrogenase
MTSRHTRREVVKAGALAVASGLLPSQSFGRAQSAIASKPRAGTAELSKALQARVKGRVIAAGEFARIHGLKVAVRGGGHNWVGFSLRDHSLLIDPGGLDRIASID